MKMKKEKANVIVKQQEEAEQGEEEAEAKETTLPFVNCSYFKFLVDEPPEVFCEGDFALSRPFRAAQNYLDNPHGSVKLLQGDTCAICAVYGPTEVRMSKELPHRSAVDVLFRPKITGIPVRSQASGWDSTFEERSVEATLTSILDSVLFLEDDLGAGYNIIVHEVQDDGCLFAACVNATALALLNAGCPSRCTFAAVTIAAKEKEDALIVDPCQVQIESGMDGLVTVVLSSDGHVLYTALDGRITPKALKLCMRQAYPACGEIFEFQRQLQKQQCLDITIGNVPGRRLPQDLVKGKEELGSDMEQDNEKGNNSVSEEGEIASD